MIKADKYLNKILIWGGMMQELKDSFLCSTGGKLLFHTRYNSEHFSFYYMSTFFLVYIACCL